MSSSDRFGEKLDESPRKQLLAFVAQEARHNVQHRRFWKQLRTHGYEFDDILSFLNILLFKGAAKRLSLNARLATVAGFERLTELVAEVALEDDFFGSADVNLRELFEWHAAEELADKTVAFDVLSQVGSGYTTRMFGMLFANAVFAFFSSWVTLRFLRRDEALFSMRTVHDLAAFAFLKERFVPRWFVHSLDYLRPGFHPKST